MSMSTLTNLIFSPQDTFKHNNSVFFFYSCFVFYNIKLNLWKFIYKNTYFSYSDNDIELQNDINIAFIIWDWNINGNFVDSILEGRT